MASGRKQPKSLAQNQKSLEAQEVRPLDQKGEVTADQLKKVLETAFEAADQAKIILQKYYGGKLLIDEKFQAGLVSQADRESEEKIRQIISRAYPDHAFLGEETGFSESGANWFESSNSSIWLIDPLDGTTNFVHRIPFFCISIALMLDGKVQVAVIDVPEMGWRYHALRGQGAFRNGQPIKVSERSTFHEGLFATGFSSQDHSLGIQMELLTRIIRDARGIRRLGAAALDLCLVAEGVFDGFWEWGLKPWDTAAGSLIAQEAGAVVTDFSGGEFHPNNPSILCAPPFHHRELIRILKQTAKS